MRLRIVMLAIVGVGLIQASEKTWAQSFSGGTNNGITWGPGPTTDNTQSLGQFTIVLNPSFSAALTAASYPGYSSSSNRLISPLLYDQNTQISRSMTTQWGSAGWSGGLPVGSAVGPIVSQSSISLTPSGFVAPPNGTDMVFTQINAFDLAAGPVSVTAGTAAMDPLLPNSVGEVISNSGTPANPALDFPARSFFDVFVDVTVPALGGSGSMVLSNAYSGAGTPLVISNSGITSFPPVVIYTHGNSTAVPLYVGPKGIDGLGTDAGDIFGLLTLAGHGAGYGQGSTGGGSTDENTGMPANGTTFEETYMSMPELPVMPQYASWGTPSDPVTVLPEPTTVSLLVVAGLAAVGFCRRRRRQIT